MYNNETLKKINELRSMQAGQELDNLVASIMITGDYTQWHPSINVLHAFDVLNWLRNKTCIYVIAYEEGFTIQYGFYQTKLAHAKDFPLAICRSILVYEKIK